MELTPTQKKLCQLFTMRASDPNSLEHQAYLGFRVAQALQSIAVLIAELDRKACPNYWTYVHKKIAILK